LFRVTRATPIVDPPARIADADQAEIVVSTPNAGPVTIRVHWSRFLHVDGPGDAELAADPTGWTVLDAQQPGRYVIGG
jgi:hypothetical protein